MHPPDDQLHEYVDRTLGDEARAALDAHLAGCAECAAHVARLRSLLDRATAAPRDVLPSRDLWPAIAAEVGRRGAPVRPLPAASDSSGVGRPSGLRRYRGRLAAAAVLLVAASSLVTALVMRDRGTADPGIASAGGSAAPGAAESAAVRGTDFRAVEAGYAREAAALQRALDVQRDSLAPETVRIVERSLQVIDDAIAEARAALERDPGNRAIRQMLEATWRQKVDLLRRSTELPRSA